MDTKHEMSNILTSDNRTTTEMQVVWQRLKHRHGTLAPSLPSYGILARTDYGQTYWTRGLLGWQRSCNCNAQLTERISLRRNHRNNIFLFPSPIRKHNSFIHWMMDKYQFQYLTIITPPVKLIVIILFSLYILLFGGKLGIRIDPILRTLGV